MRSPAAPDTPPTVTATRNPALRAVITASVPLRYRDGADAALDRPAHVRAGSGLAWVGDRLAVVQDDAAFVARVDPRTAAVDAVALPAGPRGVRQFDEGRGNKRDKLDLESCVAFEGDLYAFGSGSTAARERVVRVTGIAGDGAQVRVYDAGALYAALRAEAAFAGSELNVEGAALVGDATVLRLFQRGNGAPREGTAPVDATCDLAWDAVRAYLDDPARVSPPAPTQVTRYALGEAGGARLTFTDAAAHPGRAGAVCYLAAAEASLDTYRDGPVSGCAFGLIEPQPDGTARARYAPLSHAGTDAPVVEKPEGLALDPRDPTRAYVVLDPDDPAVPSRLCVVSLEGPW